MGKQRQIYATALLPRRAGFRCERLAWSVWRCDVVQKGREQETYAATVRPGRTVKRATGARKEKERGAVSRTTCNGLTNECGGGWWCVERERARGRRVLIL